MCSRQFESTAPGPARAVFFSRRRERCSGEPHMIRIHENLSPQALERKIRRLFEFSAQKIHSLEKSWDASQGAPVYTVKGHYTSRGWTEWTQGFQFGAEILQFDATGDRDFL